MGNDLFEVGYLDSPCAGSAVAVTSHGHKALGDISAHLLTFHPGHFAHHRAVQSQCPQIPDSSLVFCHRYRFYHGDSEIVIKGRENMPYRLRVSM